MVAVCCCVKDNTLNVHYDSKVEQLITGFSNTESFVFLLKQILTGLF